MRLADQGRVPEGVADKPFFFTFSLPAATFFCKAKVILGPRFIRFPDHCYKNNKQDSGSRCSYCAEIEGC